MRIDDIRGNVEWAVFGLYSRLETLETEIKRLSAEVERLEKEKAARRGRKPNGNQ